MVANGWAVVEDARLDEVFEIGGQAYRLVSACLWGQCGQDAPLETLYDGDIVGKLVAEIGGDTIFAIL